MSHESYFKRKPEVEDFKPVSILVFRNGDEFDPGLRVTVTRHRFPHWLHLLEYLTAKLQLTEGAVHHLYDLYRNELLHFKELENDGVYVGAFKKFKEVKYNYKNPNVGTTGVMHETRGQPANHNKNHVVLPRVTAEPKSLNSRESYEIYLKNRNFFPSTVRDMWDDSMGRRTKTVGTNVGQSHVTKSEIINKTNLTPYQLASGRSFSEPRMKVANSSVETGYYKTVGSRNQTNAHKLANQYKSNKNNSDNNIFANQLEELYRRNAATNNKQKSNVQKNVNTNGVLVTPRMGRKSNNADTSTSTEWDSDTLEEKEVSTQTVWSTERATNTTASYVKKVKSRVPQMQNNQIKRTVDSTVPAWAQQLQSAVSELSTKVEKLNI